MKFAVAATLVILSLTHVHAATDDCRQVAEAISIATEAPIDGENDNGFTFRTKPPLRLSLSCRLPDATQAAFQTTLNVDFEDYPAPLEFFDVVGAAGEAVVKLPVILIIKKAQHCLSKALKDQSGEGEVNVPGGMHVECRVSAKADQGYFKIAMSRANK
jgi:hypothetical protein